MKKQLVLAIIILPALVFGFALAWHGIFGVAGDALPAFDNAYLHVARARYIIDTGLFHESELVFGAGITPTYHVPFYPALVAGFATLSGLDVFWAVRVVSLLQVLLLGIGFYVLGKRISGGNAFAGAAAAFLAYNSVALMQWGTRNTAISFGVLLVPLALYFVLRRWWVAALLASLAIALDHPPSLLVLCLSLLVFTIASSLPAVKPFLERKWRKALADVEWLGVACGLSAFMVYMVWHVRQTGLACLDFKCLPQAAAREFGKSIDLVAYAAKFPQFLGVLGFFVAALDQKIDYRAKLLFFSWLAACVLLVKNDALGAGVFTERFITFLDEPLALTGGLLVGYAFSVVSGERKKV